MQNDTIYRQAAIELIQKENGRTYWNSTLMDSLVRLLESLPPAEPKKGKWIKRDSYCWWDNFYECSECGRLINLICGTHLEDYPFCHCGADMREKG